MPTLSGGGARNIIRATGSFFGDSEHFKLMPRPAGCSEIF